MWQMAAWWCIFAYSVCVLIVLEVLKAVVQMRKAFNDRILYGRYADNIYSYYY